MVQIAGPTIAGESNFKVVLSGASKSPKSCPGHGQFWIVFCCSTMPVARRKVGFHPLLPTDRVIPGTPFYDGPVTYSEQFSMPSQSCSWPRLSILLGNHNRRFVYSSFNYKSVTAGTSVGAVIASTHCNGQSLKGHYRHKEPRYSRLKKIGRIGEQLLTFVSRELDRRPSSTLAPTRRIY